MSRRVRLPQYTYFAVTSVIFSESSLFHKHEQGDHTITSIRAFWVPKNRCRISVLEWAMFFSFSPSFFFSRWNGSWIWLPLTFSPSACSVLTLVRTRPSSPATVLRSGEFIRGIRTACTSRTVSIQRLGLPLPSSVFLHGTGFFYIHPPLSGSKP